MSHVRSSRLPQVVLISIDSPLSWFSVRLNKPERSQMGPWISELSKTEHLEELGMREKG